MASKEGIVTLLSKIGIEKRNSSWNYALVRCHSPLRRERAKHRDLLLVITAMAHPSGKLELAKVCGYKKLAAARRHREPSTSSHSSPTAQQFPHASSFKSLFTGSKATPILAHIASHAPQSRARSRAQPGNATSVLLTEYLHISQTAKSEGLIVAGQSQKHWDSPKGEGKIVCLSAIGAHAAFLRLLCFVDA
jgi:hypothetical protein